jgi:hypothetical protein
MGGSTQTKSGPRSSGVSNAVLAKKPRTEKTQDIASSRPPRRLAALKQSENLKELLGQQEARDRGKTADNTETDDDDEDEDEDEEVVGKEEDDSVVKKGREGGAHRIKGGGSTARAAVCEDPRAVGQLVAGPALEAALSKTQKPASLG